MIRKLLHHYRRQVLLWRLHGLQGWLDEIEASESRIRAARRRTQAQIEMARTRLAKLDGEAMLDGRAEVVVR